MYAFYAQLGIPDQTQLAESVGSVGNQRGPGKFRQLPYDHP